MTDPYLSPDLLRGAGVLITGGGGGLGRELALTLHSLGASVHLWGRRRDALEAAAEHVTENSPGSAPIHVDTVDVRNADQVDAAMNRIWEGPGPLTGVVNAAAGNFIAPTESLSARAFESVTSTVMNGSFFTTQAAGKRWIRDGSKGSVVSLLTSWVWSGSAFVVPSAMAKSAVNAMTMSLAVEWAGHGIRVNAVAPGPIPTEFAWQVLDAEDDAAVTATDLRGIPAGRYGTAEEIARIVAFLLSGASDWITGETIAVDGGQRLAGPSTFSALTELDTQDWARIRDRGRAAAAAAKAHRDV